MQTHKVEPSVEGFLYIIFQLFNFLKNKINQIYFLFIYELFKPHLAFTASKTV